jgi:hypothetical protein
MAGHLFHDNTPIAYPNPANRGTSLTLAHLRVLFREPLLPDPHNFDSDHDGVGCET